MKEINEQQARSLIMSGSAGYWGICGGSVPIEHEELIVVRLRGKFWLCTSDEITVGEPHELGVVNGRAKGCFPIELKDDDLIRMAQDELNERGCNPFGPHLSDGSHRR